MKFYLFIFMTVEFGVFYKTLTKFGLQCMKLYFEFHETLSLELA